MNTVMHRKDKYAFTFQGQEYPINSIVKLNNVGRKELQTDLECVQIISHYIYNDTPIWVYRIQWEFAGPNNMLAPKYAKKTYIIPDELIDEVVLQAPLPGVEKGMQDDKLAKYWHIETIWEWVKYAILCFVMCIFKSWTFRLSMWLILFWMTYVKCEHIHSDYIMASIKTFETQYCITKEMVMDLHFNPQNIHVNKANSIEKIVQQHASNNRQKYSNPLEQCVYEICQKNIKKERVKI